MDWKKTITESLTGEAFNLPESRLDWTGYSAVYSLFANANSDEKGKILLAIREIIEDSLQSWDEQRWRVAANIIHLSSFLGGTIEILGPTIAKIRLTRAPTTELQEIINYSCAAYWSSNPSHERLNTFGDASIEARESNARQNHTREKIIDSDDQIS